MLAGPRWTGRGAASQSKAVISRSVGTARRLSKNMAVRPFRKRLSSSSALCCTASGATRWRTCRSTNHCTASRDSGRSSVSRVGAAGSSTMSPPFCQTKGARRIRVGSMPIPYCSVPLVSDRAASRKSFQVQPARG